MRETAEIELQKFVNGWLVEVAFGVYDREDLPRLADEMLAALKPIVASAKAEAYDNAKHWLEGTLSSKHDVADICDTRAKVLRGEMEAPKSRFQQSNQGDNDNV